MGELNSNRNVRIAADTVKGARDCSLSLVGPEADIAVGDAPIGQHGGRFDRQQCCAGQCQMTEMNEMPICHAAVDRRVLAHRSDNDPIGKLNSADLERGKKLGHDFTMSPSFASSRWL